MALDKEDIQALVEALRAPDARAAAEQEKRQKKLADKRKKLAQKTKKSGSHAFYRVTQLSYVSGIGLLEPGSIVELPLEPLLDKDGEPLLDDDGNERLMEPSHTWQPVKTQKEIDAAAEADVEAEAAANALANEDLETGAAAKGKAGKAGKKSGKGRASDQDVA